MSQTLMQIKVWRLNACIHFMVIVAGFVLVNRSELE